MIIILQVISGMKKSKAELLREIDAEYYGYLDDDDNLLIPQEEKCEKEGDNLLHVDLFYFYDFHILTLFVVFTFFSSST